MKILTKVALVSAMAISANAMAMQAMDDESLSAATGQDGVTISLSGPIKMDYLAIVDSNGLANTTDNGLTSTGAGKAGAIVIGKDGTGLTITPANGINLVIDADGGNTTGNASAVGPVLNINANLGNTTISGVAISVANTNATGSVIGTSAGAVGSKRVEVLDLGDLTLNGLTANIQLGSQPQGALIKLNSTITGGLVISSLALKSGADHGIGLGQVTVKDTADANATPAVTGDDLTLKLSLNTTDDGLVVSGLTKMDISSTALRLGKLSATATPALGAMYIKGLNVGTSIGIKGH